MCITNMNWLVVKIIPRMHIEYDLESLDSLLHSKEECMKCLICHKNQ